MKRPRIRLRKRWVVPIGVLLVPPLLWSIFLSVLPTDWARQRIVARLSTASGRAVRLAGLEVGFLGGVDLTGLEIGAPGSSADPWLKVAEAHINVSPLQMLWGHVEPTETEVRGLSLRVLRRSDGSLELADLIQQSRPSPDPASAVPPASACSTNCPLSHLAVRIWDARVTVIDTPTRTQIEFRDITGRAVSDRGHARIQELRGTLNGGPFEIVAQLDRTTPAPSFEGQIRAQKIALRDGMSILGYLVPVLARNVTVQEQGQGQGPDDGDVDGTLDLDLYLRGEGNTREALRRSVVGHGAVSIDPIELNGSKLMAAIESAVELPEPGRVGSVKSDFVIKQGRIGSDNLTVSVARVPFMLSGWTDFDGNLNYRVRTENLTDKLPARARELLGELANDPQTPSLSAVRVEGAYDDPTITIDGVPLNPSAGGTRVGDDRHRLRDLGRRLRDRILR